MEKKESKSVRELTPREVKVVAGGPIGTNENGHSSPTTGH